MNPIDEMVCVELVEVITDYLEGALPDEDRDRFEAHLAACGPCRRYMVQFRGVIAASGRLTPETLPEQARGDLVRLFRDWRSARG